MIWVRQRIIADRGINDIPLIIANELSYDFITMMILLFENEMSLMSPTYFLNGNRLSNFNLSSILSPAIIVLDGEKPQLLAARFDFNPHEIDNFIWRYNFRLSPDSSLQEMIRWAKTNISFYVLFIGIR